MSPNEQVSGIKRFAANNLYTIILAMALFSVLATAGLVLYKCYIQYEVLFKVP